MTHRSADQFTEQGANDHESACVQVDVLYDEEDLMPNINITVYDRDSDPIKLVSDANGVAYIAVNRAHALIFAKAGRKIYTTHPWRDCQGRRIRAHLEIVDLCVENGKACFGISTRKRKTRILYSFLWTSENPDILYYDVQVGSLAHRKNFIIRFMPSFTPAQHNTPKTDIFLNQLRMNCPSHIIPLLHNPDGLLFSKMRTNPSNIFEQTSTDAERSCRLCHENLPDKIHSTRVPLPVLVLYRSVGTGYLSLQFGSPVQFACH